MISQGSVAPFMLGTVALKTTRMEPSAHVWHTQFRLPKRKQVNTAGLALLTTPTN